MTSEQKQALQHRLAMYEQLCSLYPRDPEYLQKKVEILLQLQNNVEAELLLDKLYHLLLNQGQQQRAEETKSIRQHLSLQEHQEHFYSTPFLHLASRSFMGKAFRTHKRIEVKMGEYLIRYGEQDEQMFIVLSGELAVWSHDAQGEKNLEHVLRAGEVIGELAFLDGTPRNADVLACEDALLLAIPGKDVLKLFLENPKVEQALVQEANTRKIIVALKKNKHLKRAPEHLQRILAKQGEWLEIAALTRLHQSGENIQYVDLICSGAVRILTENKHGESVVLESLKEGALIGLDVLNVRVNNHTYMADIVCMQSTTLIRFTTTKFNDIIEHNPRLHQALIAQAQTNQDSFLHTIQSQV
ncbi:MAG: cyclic nucleotide-binding domain-containing protein [Mariprofundaceae bacterium]|nr:cyclic nucleotide-binding domain-containing protein [Mariprofundaceae bacterium]